MAPRLNPLGGPSNGRGRRLFFRLFIPAICLAALFAALGLIYRGSLELPASVVEVRPSAPPVDKTPTYESLKGQYMEMVDGGLKKLANFDGAKYRGSVSAVERELNVFQAWAIFLAEMDRYPLTETEKAKVISLAERVSALQRREFPQMRAEWARGLRKSLAEFKVIASCSGDRNESLHAICPPFAGEEGLNRSMIELQGETAARLRFSRIQLTFTEGFTLTAPIKPTKEPPPPDSELVFWREKSFEPVTWRPAGKPTK